MGRQCRTAGFETHRLPGLDGPPRRERSDPHFRAGTVRHPPRGDRFAGGTAGAGHGRAHRRSADIGQDARTASERATALPAHDRQLARGTEIALSKSYDEDDYNPTFLLNTYLDGPGEDVHYLPRSWFRRPWCTDPRLDEHLLADFNSGSISNPRLLGLVGDPRALEPLLALLKSGKARNQWETIYSIGLLGDPRALPALLAITATIDAQNADVVGYAMMNLRNLRDITPLLNALESANAQTQRCAVMALASLGDARAVPPLCRLLAESKDAGTREYCALALGYLHDSRALPALIAGLKDDTEYYRSACAWALGMVGDPRAIAPLQAALADETPRFQVRVARALCQLGDRQRLELLEQLACGDDGMTREIAFEALQGMKAKNAQVAELYAGLLEKIDNPNARGAQAEYLAAMGDARAIPPLLTGIYGEQWTGCQFIRALAEIDDPCVNELLADLLGEDTPDDQRAEAAAALLRRGDARGLDALQQIALDNASSGQTIALVALTAAADDPHNAVLLQPLLRRWPRCRHIPAECGTGGQRAGQIA